MLIDFSGVLQVNVYALGATFLKFRRLLNLELPIIDPSLYIHRFAAKLELGDKRRRAQLSLAEFNRRSDDLAEEHPPSFQRAERSRENARRLQQGLAPLDDEQRARGARVAPLPPPAAGGETALVASSSDIVEGSIALEAAPPTRRRADKRQRELDQREKCYEEIREMLENEDAEAPATSAVAAKAPIPATTTTTTATATRPRRPRTPDDEIDGFILTDEEVKQKRRRGRKASAGKAKGARVKDSRTAKEALIDVVEKKRFSKKINYGVLEGIFGDARRAPRRAARKRAAVAPASTAAPAEAQRAEKRARLASVADETTVEDGAARSAQRDAPRARPGRRRDDDDETTTRATTTTTRTTTAARSATSVSCKVR
ncbi:transcription factor IIIB [Aureococcus anophagefferens]|uniref:Transcription factor IIIB n=1 Tax=Aureococcus anophagefferens TaxID=44056 RepID=A0ABR1G1Q3_AURAN